MFAGHLSTEEVLLLWDRIIGFNSLEVLPGMFHCAWCQGFTDGHQGFTGGHQGFTGRHQGFTGGHQGFTGVHQGFVSGHSSVPHIKLNCVM